jgi:ribosomal protein S18 acetylase RimI-like enzyme
VSTFAEYEPDARRQVLDTPIEIRPMGADDLDACAELIVSRTGGPAAERRSRLLSDLHDPTRYSVVAGVGTEVVGYAAVIHHELSPDDPPTMAPTGYYLVGLIVSPDWRRHGIGELLTTERIRWTAERADTVYYFANLANGPILDLHQCFGFTEVTRDFTFPRAPLEPGTGILLRAELS